MVLLPIQLLQTASLATQSVPLVQPTLVCAHLAVLLLSILTPLVFHHVLLSISMDQPVQPVVSRLVSRAKISQPHV